MFSILRFRQGCLYFYFYSSVWVSSVLQRGLILGALEGVLPPGSWGDDAEKKLHIIFLHLSQTCPCSQWHVFISFAFSWILLKRKEAAVCFVLSCCLHATHGFTNLQVIPWQSAYSQGHSPWESAGFIFLIVILMLLSLVSKDFLFLFSMFQEHKAAVLFIGMFTCHLPTILKAKL